MAIVILDNMVDKNNIGIAISAEMDKRESKIVQIVSPYVSDIEKYINIGKGIKIKLICNAHSNSCNPYTLESLIKNGSVSVKTRNDIHAKAYIFDNSAFVTSANATPNGIGGGTLEAAVKLHDEKEIFDIKNWFNQLWEDSGSDDIKHFTQEEWEKLKSNWRISNREQKSKPFLYDLIITKRIPPNVSFTFWCDAERVPKKERVKNEALKSNLVELPKDIKNWDYFIEAEMKNDDAEQTEALEEVLKTYYNHTMINIKVNNWPFTKSYVRGYFPSKLLDTPIKLNWNRKVLLLALYRNDNISTDFVFDGKVSRLINESIKKNKEKWKEYFSSSSGKYGYCSSKQLYNLVDGCSISV